MASLKKGSRGKDVETWQQFLQQQGYAPGKVDGRFGSKTTAATKRFQKAAGLKADGIVGPRTRKAASDLGHLPGSTTDIDVDLDSVQDYSIRLGIPAGINQGVSRARQKTMLEVLGKPGDKTTDCSTPTSSRLKKLLVTENVGPFRVTGLKPAVALVRKIFAAVKEDHPVLYNQLGTAGMLCCRKVRGGSNFSNHSWGTAVDIKINGALDKVDDNRCQLGLKILADYFNEAGFFWGAGFSREDSMHFEVSDELIRKWKANGAI